jgi:tRNA(Arg) A34 adenosine deaminase TadA/CheY-like chemotaxis protein
MTPAQPAKKGHILVVEKDDITRKLIVGILNNKGYATYEAADGDAAVAFLRKDMSLVILDYAQESPDSRGLILKLQDGYGKVPVIAMTTDDNHAAVRDRIGVERVSVLQKPVMPDALLQNIQASVLSGVEEKIEEVEKRARPALAEEPPALRAAREKFMRHAIDLSQEKMDDNCGGPFGAIIVRDGRIVAEGWNQVTSTGDPTAHAEMVAIRAATRALGDYQLAGCEIYTSCEPCPMCLAAIYWARLDRVFYANTREDAARIGFDDDFIYRELASPEDKRSLPAQMLLRPEAKIVFDNWMKKADKTPY